jgi:hypothetical protein
VAAAAHARIGYGPWRYSRGAREGLPREERICLHCEWHVPETVVHSLTECDAFADLRAELRMKLDYQLSSGLVSQLGEPAENPSLWSATLLQAPCEELGADYCRSLRSLEAAIDEASRHIELPARGAKSANAAAVNVFHWETRRAVLNTARTDRKTLRPSASGTFIVCCSAGNTATAYGSCTR